MSESTRSDDEPVVGLEAERPMSGEILNSAEMTAKIAKAEERARRGRTSPGKTADDLLELAREQRRVDPRT
jgi:hypothetical protein